MENDGRFHVSRRGREIFVGSSEALERHAADGLIGANDLVFDPGAESWVFARNLPALDEVELPSTPRDLLGDALRAERPPPPKREPLPTIELGTIEDDDELEGRSPLLYVAIGTTVLLALVVVAAAFWPEQVGLGDYFAQTGAALQGMQSPLGGKEYAERLEKAKATGSGTPSVAGPARPGASTNALAATGDPGDRDLTFDLRAPPPPGVLVRPTPEEAYRYGMKYSAAARQAAAAADGGNAETQMDRLMLAMHHAQFATINLGRAQGFPGADEARDETKQVIEELEEKFMGACGQKHDERFCELKLEHPDWTDSVIRLIAAEKIHVGMSTEQLRAAWGAPLRLRREGDKTRFCYGQFCTRSVMISAGVVVGIDDD